jgi:hypothetical protein
MCRPKMAALHGPSNYGIAMRSPESKLSPYFTPWDAGFACVSFDRGVQIAQVLQVFYPPAEALELGMKLADGGTVRLALFGGSIHMLLFDALQQTRMGFYPIPC